MEVDEPAGTSMDTSEPLEPAIEWRFSQVKGNIEGDDTHTEGSSAFFVLFSLQHSLVFDIYVRF